VGRGSYLILFLFFVLLLIVISRGFRLEGSFLPPCPHSRPGGTPNLPPFPSCLLPFIVDTVGLPPHCILKQGYPTRAAACIPKILHKNAYALKSRN
jgi:hypothetical protein